MKHNFDTQNTDTELHQNKHYKGPKNTVKQIRNGTPRFTDAAQPLVHFFTNVFSTKKPSTLTLEMQKEIIASEHLIENELDIFDMEHHIIPEVRTPVQNQVFYSEQVQLDYLITKTTRQSKESIEDPVDLDKMHKLKAKFVFTRPTKFSPIPDSVLKHTWPLPLMAYNYLGYGLRSVENGNKIIIHFETSLWHLFYSVEHDHLVFRARPGVQNTSYREKKTKVHDNSQMELDKDVVKLSYIDNLEWAAFMLSYAGDNLSKKKSVLLNTLILMILYPKNLLRPMIYIHTYLMILILRGYILLARIKLKYVKKTLRKAIKKYF